MFFAALMNWGKRVIPMDSVHLKGVEPRCSEAARTFLPVPSGKPGPWYCWKTDPPTSPEETPENERVPCESRGALAN